MAKVDKTCGGVITRGHLIYEYFIFLNITFTVSCGGHSADTCENCVFDASCVFQGSSWCNGDCIWDSDLSKCIKTSK